MNRSSLVRAAEGAVTTRGYNFHTSTEEYLPASVTRLPAAFLAEPRFSSIEGRRRGKITYSLTLHLLADGAKIPPDLRHELLDRLESDALGIFAEMSENDRVLCVENMQMTPSAMALTVRGDVSLTVKADVVCLFENL